NDSVALHNAGYPEWLVSSNQDGEVAIPKGTAFKENGRFLQNVGSVLLQSPIDKGLDCGRMHQGIQCCQGVLIVKNTFRKVFSVEFPACQVSLFAKAFLDSADEIRICVHDRFCRAVCIEYRYAQ